MEGKRVYSKAHRMRSVVCMKVAGNVLHMDSKWASRRSRQIDDSRSTNNPNRN